MTPRDGSETTGLRAVFDPTARHVIPEVMDQPGLDVALHRQALGALRRVNWLSRTADSLWEPIVELASQHSEADLTLVDVACGGGDVACRLAQRAQTARLRLNVSACDVSPAAIDFARRQPVRDLPKPLEFFQHDVLSTPLPGTWDVVTCTLFLHHLNEAEAVTLLTRMAAAARRLVIINDLRRTRVGFWMAHAAARLLTRSPVVRVDAPLSVAAALTLAEVRQLADRCGWNGYSLRKIWPERFLLSWRKP
ncbi:MAG: methyltransferase domain-containing protein [Planctomycetaceae bacterium]|nr:MAG: methyltransferase domain-containing protein [Planctomycetaceae bacterium]